MLVVSLSNKRMKIFSTILIILIIIAVGFGAYWYFTKDESGGSPLSNISIGDFFPFGQSPEETPGTPVAVEQPNTDEEPVVPQETGGGNLVLPKLAKLSAAEQAGATIFASSTETIVRYVDRQTGNIYEYNISHPEKGRMRVTNTTVPKIHSAVWFEKGTSLLLEYTDNRSDIVQVVYGTIVPGKKGSTTDAIVYKELQTSFVGDSIMPVANPGLQKIAYIDSINGGNALTIANKNGASSKNITQFATSEWDVSWPAEGTIIMHTKPSASTAGFAYAVNTTNGSLRKILGDLNGLIVKPKANADTVLYSQSGPSLGLYTKSTNKTEGLTFKTLADKCTWGSKDTFYCGVPKTLPGGTYPDSWYMGTVSFDDSVWSYDIITGARKQLFDPKTVTNEEFDVTNIVVDPSEKFILFTNKKDSSLWVYTL